MIERASRLWAVARADFLIRLRRPSTVIVFLLLSAIPYLWIPDPATGRALIEVNGRRALYNSAAIGMATAALCCLFIGLIGFYVISNALRRDVISRCGYVIASTTMRSSEYLAGKFLGNVVFLSVFTFGFMATSMAMVLVRGEAPLQPFVFAYQYLLLLPPTIIFVSAIAIAFESIPWLSGKFGDVVYFILWVTGMGVTAAKMEKAGAVSWAATFDITGMGFIIQQIKRELGTSSLSLGASQFDPTKGVINYNGLQPTLLEFLPRIATMLWPFVLLVVARFFFHRFDPARVRAAAVRAKQSWMGRFNALAKPLARLFMVLASHGTGGSFLASARADALMSIAAFPLAAVALVVTMFVPLPIAFAIVAVVIADVATREKRSGTTALIYAAPHSLRSTFVLWKLTSTLMLTTLFLIVPLIRTAIANPGRLPALAIGILFVTAAATALGTISSNPKTFTVVFLTFWYLAINDHGVNPTWDFAGFFNVATPAITATYAAIAIAFVIAAQLFHTAQLRRAW